LARAEDGIVREVVDELRVVLGDRRLERRRERHTVVRDAPQLLGSADEHHRHHLVHDLAERAPNHGRVVLAVDQNDRAAHPRVVTSRSIRPVYFSYSSVSVENWMMRSWPWNGCRRETSTWRPVTSITL